MFEFLILMLITVFGLALLIIWLVQYDKANNARASRKAHLDFIEQNYKNLSKNMIEFATLAPHPLTSSVQDFEKKQKFLDAVGQPYALCERVYLRSYNHCDGQLAKVILVREEDYAALYLAYQQYEERIMDTQYELTKRKANAYLNKIGLPNL